MKYGSDGVGEHEMRRILLEDLGVTSQFSTLLKNGDVRVHWTDIDLVRFAPDDLVSRIRAVFPNAEILLVEQASLPRKYGGQRVTFRIPGQFPLLVHSRNDTVSIDPETGEILGAPEYPLSLEQIAEILAQLDHGAGHLTHDAGNPTHDAGALPAVPDARDVIRVLPGEDMHTTLPAGSGLYAPDDIDLTIDWVEPLLEPAQPRDVPVRPELVPDQSDPDPFVPGGLDPHA